TNVSALRWVEQAAVGHERLMWVNPLSVAGVPQFGKTFVLLVLPLTMLTVMARASLETSASGPGGGPPGVQFCPWLDATRIALATSVRHCALARGAARAANVAIRITAPPRPPLLETH